MKADAIVHPGAVVVHFQGASLAHRTVMGPGHWASWVAQLLFLSSPIIIWHCPLNNSCCEDLIDVALASGDGCSQVIDIVATVYIGIKENLNNNLKTLFTCLVWCKGTSRNIWQHSEHFSAWSCSQADLPRRRARPSIPPRTEQCAVSPPIKQLDPLSST